MLFKAKSWSDYELIQKSNQLEKDFKSMQNEFYVGFLLNLQKCEFNVEQIPKNIENRNDIAALLNAFQLVVATGISYDYIKGLKRKIYFSNILSETFHDEPKTLLSFYRENLLDFKGKTSLIINYTASTLYEMLGKPSAREKFLLSASSCLHLLMGLTQCKICGLFNDFKMVRKLKKIIYKDLVYSI
jgi:hypothetical protein